MRYWPKCAPSGQNEQPVSVQLSLPSNRVRLPAPRLGRAGHLPRRGARRRCRGRAVTRQRGPASCARKATRGRMRRPRDGRQQRQKNSSVKTSPAQARPAYTLQLQSQMQTSNRLPTGAAAAAAHGPTMQAAGAAQGAACTPNIKSRVCARGAPVGPKFCSAHPGDAAARTHRQPAPPAALPWCGAKIITHPT